MSGYIPNEKDIIPKQPATDSCWETGEYNDDCDCEMCDHRHECSGYEGDDWEE